MCRRLAAALLLGASQAALAQPAAGPPPNILLIVADDLGIADLGAFGGEIETPNLDSLAREGNRLDRFHAAPTCSPSRAMLLTGTDAHTAGLGTMAELVTPAQAGRPAYRGELAPDVPTLGERLQAAGYRTLFAGKWHLGGGGPAARGFSSSFALMQAGHHHFGADAGAGVTYLDNGRAVARLPVDFYSSTAFADRLIVDLKATSPDIPVFATLAFTAPHWPLMAPTADIARQKGRYDDGYEALRERRIARQKALGILPATAAARAMELPPGTRWAELSADNRAKAARRMEVYAAMVTRMDAEIGRVRAELKRSGRDRNTIILFLSDNGAEAVDLTRAAAGFRAAGGGGSHGAAFQQGIARADNSLASLGTAASYAAYGPGWAQAGNGIGWLWKAFPTEGGTWVPAILRVPGARPGPIRARLDIRDVAPTLLELAGVASAPTAGRSWKPLLGGSATSVRGDDDVLAHELFGARSLRAGAWKLLDVGDRRWQLFDLDADPGETHDLAPADPARVAALSARWESWARDSGVVPPGRPIPMLMRPGAPDAGAPPAGTPPLQEAP